jgi:hypothetical protein
MTDDLLAAATRLAEAIAAENAALAAFNVPAAVAAGGRKQHAAEAFEAALRAQTAPMEPSRCQRAEMIGRHLAGLAQENRRLLERAIAAQRRVMEIIARAGRRELAERASRYGAFGAPIATARPRPIAISARA